jgi:hypothetical protein
MLQDLQDFQQLEELKIHSPRTRGAYMVAVY